MAERKILPNTILLFLGEAADDLSTIVCLTSIRNSFTVDELDATTWCGIAKEPGIFSGNISFSGQHLLDPDTGKVSGHSLFEWMKGKTILFYEISPAVPADGDIIQTGSGFINSLSNDYSLDQATTFSATLSIDGEPDEVIAAVSRMLDETGDYTLAETGYFILIE